MKVSTCSFFPAFWTQYCSLAHSLHSACTRNKKPTWNPEAWWCKKKKKFGQWFWFGPHRHRYGDKEGTSSHGLAPIGSKPADKQILSTLSFHPPPTHQPKLSYYRGRNKSSLRLAFVHINKPFTVVKQYMGEESRWNKPLLSGLYQQTTECEAQLFPVSTVGEFSICMRCSGRKTNFYISCGLCLLIV